MNSLRKLWRRLRGEEVHTSPFLVQPTGQQTEATAVEPPHYTYSTTYSAARYYTGVTGSAILSSYTDRPTASVTPPPEPPPAPKTFRAPIAGVESKRSILRNE